MVITNENEKILARFYNRYFKLFYYDPCSDLPKILKKPITTDKNILKRSIFISLTTPR